jgi:hypothetical protein
MLVLASILVYGLFSNASELVRLGAFVFLLAGFVFFVFAIAHVSGGHGGGTSGGLLIKIEVIPNRKDLYLRLAHLINEAKKEVLDTTWGPTPPLLTEEEAKGLSIYQQAMLHASKTKQEGFRYNELFTLTKRDTARTTRYESALEFSKKNPAYIVRKLTGSMSIKTPDFGVFDREVVVISHVTSTGGANQYRFLLIRSKPVAELFAGWFMECWRDSKVSFDDNGGNSTKP